MYQETPGIQSSLCLVAILRYSLRQICIQVLERERRGGRKRREGEHPKAQWALLFVVGRAHCLLPAEVTNNLEKGDVEVLLLPLSVCFQEHD